MRTIADMLHGKGVSPAIGQKVHYPADPMDWMFFNILATFAKFAGDLIPMRTLEGMAVNQTKWRLGGSQPKPSDRQRKELGGMRTVGNQTITELADLFLVSRPLFGRTLRRST